MKALLIIFFLPNANTPATLSADFATIETSSVSACETYAKALTELHAANEDPRTLNVNCALAEG